MIQSCLLTGSGPRGIFPVEPERRGGVFLKLLDARVFNAVTVNPESGCVEWPGGIDLCMRCATRALGRGQKPTPPALHFGIAYMGLAAVELDHGRFKEESGRHA